MPPADPKGYVICTEPRSGSTWLCELLRSTGQLGNPSEYFASPARRAALEKDPGGLDERIRDWSSANGVYGVKAMGHDLDYTLSARWLSRLPNLRFVHLERRDLLGQAISLVRARQTNSYRSTLPTGTSGGAAAARYDARAIASAIRRTAVNQSRWRAYFARNGIAPLWLVYEEVAADPEGAVARLAAHIGVESPRIDPDLVALKVQRDALSDQWRERFAAEQRDLDRLDQPFGDWRVGLRRFVRDRGWDMSRLLGRWTPLP